jgi:uracil-DNA glycosylase family 4
MPAWQLHHPSVDEGRISLATEWVGERMKQKEVQKLETLARAARRCTRCRLHESRTHAVPGEGPPTARVMVIGEAPGGQEDKEGRPFVGSAGRMLDELLRRSGIRREDCFITNIVKCRPPGNRTPRKDEVETCTSHYLSEQVELINPRLVILLGGTAAKAVLNASSVGAVRGQAIERDGRTFLVSYHPAVRFYREDLWRQVEEDFTRIADEVKKL